MESENGANNKVQWVYAAENNEQLADRYDEWAKDYDADLETDFGYVMPRAAAEVFAQYAAMDGKVLDAGAGTGLVGRELQRLGYANIDAMDMSRGMLEQARGKGVYGEFYRMTLGEPLAFPDGAYDAVICVGVLTVGHAPASALDELARITKRGGCIAFTLRPDIYENNGFREKQRQIEASGKWELVQTTDPYLGLPKGEPNVFFQTWVYRVTA